MEKTPENNKILNQEEIRNKIKHRFKSKKNRIELTDENKEIINQFNSREELKNKLKETIKNKTDSRNKNNKKESPKNVNEIAQQLIHDPNYISTMINKMKEEKYDINDKSEMIDMLEKLKNKPDLIQKSLERIKKEPELLKKSIQK